jgi:hypothetical protein
MEKVLPSNHGGDIRLSITMIVFLRSYTYYKSDLIVNNVLQSLARFLSNQKFLFDLIISIKTGELPCAITTCFSYANSTIIRLLLGLYVTVNLEVFC